MEYPTSKEEFKKCLTGYKSYTLHLHEYYEYCTMFTPITKTNTLLPVGDNVVGVGNVVLNAIRCKYAKKCKKIHEDLKDE